MHCHHNHIDMSQDTHHVITAEMLNLPQWLCGVALDLPNLLPEMRHMLSCCADFHVRMLTMNDM
jgi:hypothetical protein